MTYWQFWCQYCRMESRLREVLGNDRYRGTVFGWIFLVLMGCMNLFRGSTHLLTADGGAERIAGIDLSQNGEVILTLFATMGLTQLLMAGIDFAVAFRLRALVPALLVYHLLQQFGAGIILWWWRPLPMEAPGKFGPFLLIPLTALALWAALRRRSAMTAMTAMTIKEH